MSSHSFLDNLEWSFFKKYYGNRKKLFSNAQHNFAKAEVISKCENDKPWKSKIG